MKIYIASIDSKEKKLLQSFAKHIFITQFKHWNRYDRFNLSST